MLLVVITNLSIYLRKLSSSFHIWNNISVNHQNYHREALKLFIEALHLIAQKN